MGLGNSAIQIEENKHKEVIKEMCNSNKTDQKFLLKLFRDEYDKICVLWNNNKIHGYHFIHCTFIISYLQDKYLFTLYNKLIDKWNIGECKGNDFELISKYIDEIYKKK